MPPGCHDELCPDWSLWVSFRPAVATPDSFASAGCADCSSDVSSSSSSSSFAKEAGTRLMCLLIERTSSPIAISDSTSSNRPSGVDLPKSSPLPPGSAPSGCARNVVAACTAPLCSVVAANVGRSEEHTSELQSRFDLVCRLLLEKKKRY